MSGIRVGEDRSAVVAACTGTNENVENFANYGENGEEEGGSEQEGTSKLDYRDLVSLGREQYQRQYHPLTQPDCDEEESQSVRNDEEEEEEETAGGDNEDSALYSSSSVAAALCNNNDDEDTAGNTMMAINETEEDGQYGRLLTQAEGDGDDFGDSISNDEFDYYSNGSISDRQQHDDSDIESDDEDDSDNVESGGDEDDASSSSGSSSSSDESASLEQDLRDMETTPRIVRNRRRAIQRNEERLRVLMQGVDRPGGGNVAQENGGANNEGNRISGATKKRKRRKVGHSGVKSPGKDQQCSGRRRGMLFATRFNSMAYKPQQQQQQKGLGQLQGGCCLNAGGLINGSVEAAAAQQQHHRRSATKL